MKKVLVTGGAGFIGSHFVDIENHSVACVVDRITYASTKKSLKIAAKSNFYQADIRDEAAIVKACVENDVDVILNFAAETHVDNSIRCCKSFIESNIDGVRNLLDVCLRLDIQMVHVSTDEVYGPASDKPFSEIDRLNPKNPYAATKAAAEMLIESYRNTHGSRCAVLRPSNNFGPRQHQEKFVPKLMKSIKASKPFPLYGDGCHVREWLYVKDCVNIISKLIQRFDLGNQTINIGNPNSSMTNIEACRVIFQKTCPVYGLDPEIEMARILKFVDDRPGHDRKYAISTEKLRSMLPDDVKYTTFEDAIEDTVVSEYFS